MTEPLLVIYSHSQYHDVLHIATSFLTNYKNKILLIDNNFKNDEYDKEYLKIIKYEDNIPYASRLLCLNDIADEIILFMHDMDILIKYDINILNALKLYMLDNKVDKIELQHGTWWYDSDTPLKQTYNMQNKEIFFNDSCNLYKINNPDFFVFNLNPTLWRKVALLSIMSNFKNYVYRDIESKEIQEYTTSNFNCLSLKCQPYVKCGYTICATFFQYIHSTHDGKFAQLKEKFYIEDNNNFKHLDNTYLLDKEVYDIYINKIYEPYIKNSTRGMRKRFPL